MHEMSIAMNIIELASAAAQAECADSISGIELEIGDLAGVMVESLEFCFEAAAKGTLAEDACLKIVVIPGEAKCMNCQSTSPVNSYGSQCPQCGEWLLNITKGRDLRIRAITINDER